MVLDNDETKTHEKNDEVENIKTDIQENSNLEEITEKNMEDIMKNEKFKECILEIVKEYIDGKSANKDTEKKVIEFPIEEFYEILVKLELLTEENMSEMRDKLDNLYKGEEDMKSFFKWLFGLFKSDREKYQENIEDLEMKKNKLKDEIEKLKKELEKQENINSDLKSKYKEEERNLKDTIEKSNNEINQLENKKSELEKCIVEKEDKVDKLNEDVNDRQKTIDA